MNITDYIKHDVKTKLIKYRENKLIVITFVQNDCHWNEHTQASVLAIGQQRYQSATAPRHATHTVNPSTS